MQTVASEIVAQRGSVDQAPITPAPNPKVLRFRISERRLHWAIALPFLGCFLTALVLVLVYNPDPGRPYRAVLSYMHRGSGFLLTVLPALAVTRSRHDLRIHFQNIKQAWIWVLGDIKWLALFGLAVFNKRIPLPEQGKFNAAQKLNFMMVMSTYPFYLATGLLMWVTGAALLSWLIHMFMALVATPFLFGHIFMATVPRDTRAALQGMFSGFVDRRWAKHHHARWYRQQFGHADPPEPAVLESVPEAESARGAEPARAVAPLHQAHPARGADRIRSDEPDPRAGAA